MAVDLWDWPEQVQPNAQIVSVPGEMREERIALSGVERSNRIAGGRNMLTMTFPAIRTVNRRWASWLASRLPGSLFRVRLDRSAQVAWTDAMSAAIDATVCGLPFSNGQPFSTGVGFLFNPTGDLASGVSKGTVTATVDLTRWPDALQVGHIFGLGLATYHVMDVDYDGDADGTLATVTFTPPARRDVAAGEWVYLRPTMVCKAVNPAAFSRPFQHARHMQPDALVMREVVDGDWL